MRVQDGKEVHLHRGHLGREGLLDEPAVRLGEGVRGLLGGGGHERRAVEQTGQNAHHVVTHVRRPVIRRTEGFVDADLRILVEPPGQPLFLPVAELLADGPGEAFVFVDLLDQRFPVLHVGTAERSGRAGEVEFPVPRVHSLDAIRHARGVVPDGTDLQIGRVLAFPGTVVAGLGVEPVDQAGPFVDVNNAAVHGHDLGAAHAAMGVLPLDLALQIAGHHGFSGFRTGPAEKDLLAVGGAGERHTVIAAPVGGERAVPRRVAAVAGPAA